MVQKEDEEEDRTLCSRARIPADEDGGRTRRGRLGRTLGQMSGETTTMPPPLPRLPRLPSYIAPHAELVCLQLRRGPLARLLDAKVVGATGEAEPSLLPPVSPPRIAADPVVLPSGGRAIPGDGDLVVLLCAVRRVLEDSPLVVLERLSHTHAATDRPARTDLSLHGVVVRLGVGALDEPELVDV